MSLNLTVPDPSDPDDPVDVDAARRIDALHNRLFLDPIFRGSYPADLLEDTAHLDWQGGPWQRRRPRRRPRRDLHARSTCWA